MKIADLAGKKVCILGFGREGQATLRAIEKYAPSAEVTIADANPDIAKLETGGHTLKTGPMYLEGLSNYDIIVKAPGLPPKPEFDAVKEKITNAAEIFLESIADTGAIVIGITGTKGKSTTASLIHSILTEAGKKTFLVGNIGNPVLDHIAEADENTIFVQEMSSYQLQETKVSPHIAVVTSFFPEHLDYHGSLEAYQDAKKHIVKFQKKGDLVFFPAHDKGAADIAMASPAEKIEVDTKHVPIRIDDTQIKGEHNLRNIALAMAVAKRLRIDETVAIKGVKKFKGLPRRLESIGTHHGIEWVDDAISTTPESTIAALDALGENVSTIVLGGMDRGSEFMKLAARLRESRVKTIIFLGLNTERMKKTFENEHVTQEMILAHSMEDVVKAAKEKTEQGKICLLSPASPSYDMFKNFEAKGDAFKTEILK